MISVSFNKRYIQARKAFIERDFPNLNDMQRAAVSATQGPLLVLAGAGSGKTTVLISRIANLIKYGRASDSEDVPESASQEDLDFLEDYLKDPAGKDERRAARLCALDPAAPWSIIAITFTNKAANELKERLERMLGPSGLDVWASTFHSACVRILRRDIDRLGFEKSFTIYDSSDSERVMKSVIKALNLEEKQFPARSVLGYVSRAKDAMQSPELFEKANQSGGDYRISRIARAYAEYQKRLREANALDFDDIILHTVTLLLKYEDVRDYYQKKFRYVLIDEYQDTNNLQYLLASTLAGKYKNICVVGDDDQSIYRFRGATVENILSFEKQYHNVRVIRLEQNYRSTKNILEAANKVIGHNLGRKGKSLWTDNEDGARITLFQGMNEHDEVEFIAGQMLEGVAKGMSWKDFAVLYRMNAQSNRLEDAFKRNGIPYRIVGGIRFFDRAEVKDMLAYLCLIHNHTDDLRLKRIINTPPRGIGAKTMETAEYLAYRDSKPVYEVLKQAESYPELGRGAKTLVAFAGMIEELSALSEKVPLSEFYEAVMERTGYVLALETKGDIEAQGRLENVRELKSSLINYEKDNEESSLGSFLDEVALFTDIERYDEAADATIMMTMHSAKGLEFPVVFIAGAEEGIFPGMRSIADPEEIEEERRLCYVAITRARRQLFITCATERTLFGQTMHNRVSRFIEEIPGEQIDANMWRAQQAADVQPDSVSPYAGRPMQRRARITVNAADTYAKNTARPQQRESPAIPYKKGDMVEHKAFGRGLVVGAQPMGGDALLEIAFDGVGTKRLMAKSASQFLKLAD